MLNRAALKRRHRGDNDVPRSSTKNVQRDVVHETALDDPTVNQTAEKRLEDSVFGGKRDFVENITKPKQTPEVRKRPKVDNAPVWKMMKMKTRHFLLTRCHIIHNGLNLIGRNRTTVAMKVIRKQKIFCNEQGITFAHRKPFRKTLSR